MKFTFACFLCFLTFFCTHYPPEIEKVLQSAGDNRSELEKALKHYSNPHNSLKLPATGFLVTHMQGMMLSITLLINLNLAQNYKYLAQ